MFSLSNALLLEIPSLDALEARGRGLVEYAQRDTTGFAFWAAIWAGSFVITFLLLRMLFTRWGDTNVTRKTMVLSLLAHLLLGLLSTRMVFSHTSGGGRGSGREVIVRPSKRTIVEGETFADGSQLTGRPVWERQPSAMSTAPSRIAKAPAASDIEELAHRPTAEEAFSPLALPDIPAGGPPVVPEPQRDRPAPLRPAEISHPLLAEETAGARPEATAPSHEPARTPRSAANAVDVDPQRPPRTTAPDGAPLSLPPTNVAGPVGDPQADPRRSQPLEGSTITATPPTGPAPSAEPAGTPADARGAGGQGPTRAFAREGRPSGTELPGSGSPLVHSRDASSADTGALRAIPTRAGPSAGPVPDGLKPEVVRPDSVGAIDVGGGKVPAPYRLRGLPQRKKLAIDMGGTEDSERAVEASLQWLARHQNHDGCWLPIEATLGHEPDVRFSDLPERQRSGLQSESGLTALALLAFLGANYTHEDNLYADNVDRGLRWLIARQESDGYLGGRANRYAGLYCHGMATIALGEAYGMTKDPALRDPLERAVRYIVEVQNTADGGWRYDKTLSGDMSMFGWQLMALKSAHTAGLKVPRTAVERAIDFLMANGEDLKTRRLSRYGGLAAYRNADRPKPSMTAESLFCKQMLGVKRDDPAVTEAIDYLMQNLPRRSQQDLYYWYYGTLAMYQYGGEPWRRWNDGMRDNLVNDQRTDGDFAGSWNPRAPWGDYGGRVFSTALSTLCLEVYYRFLPLYQLSGRPEPLPTK